MPVPQRIATFDNDGTLWSEQPIYFQFAFALDRVKALAPQHPEWKTQQPFKAVLDGDIKSIVTSGEKGLVELLIATHTGMTTDEFTQSVADWLRTAKHPTRKKAYTDLVHQPMLELLTYSALTDSRLSLFRGTVEFMRAFAEKVYGFPEQVVGQLHKFQLGSDGAAPNAKPKIEFIDDGPGASRNSTFQVDARSWHLKFGEITDA